MVGSSEVSVIRVEPGRIISILSENEPVPGCTISRPIVSDERIGISFFSLAKGTDIGAESYSYPRLFIVDEGSIGFFDINGTTTFVAKGECAFFDRDTPLGVSADKDSVYTEMDLLGVSMNQAIKDGTVFEMGSLVPYQEGRIVNMDLINENGVKYVLMAFDEGTGLSEHAAPGEAIVFAIDGKATIGYEGEEHTIVKGQCFKFAKGGKHYVKALGRFKMALLLMKP